MRKKLIKPGSESGYIGDKPKYKAPPKVYDLSGMDDYYRRRDMVLLYDMFVCDETKDEIKLKYGL